MIVLKMTSDYRQYLSGMTYAFRDADVTDTVVDKVGTAE